MRLTFDEQLSALLPMLLSGVLSGILYDFTRLSRLVLRLTPFAPFPGLCKRFPRLFRTAEERKGRPARALKSLFIALGDILFFSLSAALFSVFLYHYASGELRWFFLLAFGGGFLLYYISLARITYPITSLVWQLVLGAIRFLWHVLMIPVQAFLRIIPRLLSRITRPIHDRILYAYRAYYTRRTTKKIPSAVRLTREENQT